jgi:hypothetical protein
MRRVIYKMKRNELKTDVQEDIGSEINVIPNIGQGNSFFDYFLLEENDF